MKNKSAALILATAAIIGALVIIPAFAQTAEPEPEAEWCPPCGNWDGEIWTFEEGEEPWWYEEGIEPPCYDPETGEYTPRNPDGVGGGYCWDEDGESPSTRRGGCGGGRRGGCLGSS
jgi:hypothetical protein